MTTSLLLDTCAVIWIGSGAPLAPDAMLALRGCDRLLLSPISAWELQLLCSPRSPGRKPLVLLPDCPAWLSALTAQHGIVEAPLTIPIALDSQLLPGPFHADPADRFLVATARLHAVPILTRDRKILDYASLGHVQALAC